MSYRLEQLESIVSQVFPALKPVIELNHIICGYSVYLKKQSGEIYIEIPAIDFIGDYLSLPPKNLADLYEENRRIVRRLSCYL
jgi:hypothetical protein